MASKLGKHRRPIAKKESTTYRVDLARAWVNVTLIEGGIYMYSLFVPQIPGPVGFLWGLGLGVDGVGGLENRFDVFGCYTPEWARRQGIASRLYTELFKQNDIISTGQGTDEGAAFLKAFGFEHSGAIGIWWMRKPSDGKEKA